MCNSQKKIGKTITTSEEVSADWLTLMLRENAHLDQGSIITVQVLEKLHAEPFFSNISHLKVQYSEDALNSAPRRLLLKLSKPDLAPGILSWGKKEVDFYNTLADDSGTLPFVRCYSASYSPETGSSHVLLDDLSETHFQRPWPLPPSQLHCKLLMQSLAQLHAYWWERPPARGRLVEDSVMNLLHQVQKVFPAFVDFVGDGISSARRQIYETVLASGIFSRLRGRLKEGRAITLVHGDSHFANFLLPYDMSDGRVYIIDWHMWTTSVGTNDLAFLIPVQWYPERRKNLEQGLVRHYHRSLVAHGVDGYDWDNCWYDYRVSTLLQIFTPILQWAIGLDPGYWWSNLERIMMAYSDLDCAELLEE